VHELPSISFKKRLMALKPELSPSIVSSMQNQQFGEKEIRTGDAAASAFQPSRQNKQIRN
jgi:hypothetical protein